MKVQNASTQNGEQLDQQRDIIYLVEVTLKKFCFSHIS